MREHEQDDERVRRLNEEHKARSLADEAHLGPGPAAWESGVARMLFALYDRLRGRRR